MKSWHLVVFQCFWYLPLVSHALSLAWRMDPPTSIQPVIRSLHGPEDQELVWQFLMHAAQECDLEKVKENPLLQPYAQSFGERKGDIGVVALEPSEKGEPTFAMGAAWVRFLPGVGFATAYMKEDNTNNEEFQLVQSLPELAISCLPECRGKGVGSLLLQSLFQQVASEYPGIVLSCRTNNPALRLYERVGFVKVEGSDHGNRTEGASLTMKYMFEEEHNK